MVRYWLFVVSTLLLTVLIGFSTFATARLLKHWHPDRNLLLLPGENGIRLVLIALCLGLGKLSGLGEAQLGWQFHQPTRQLLTGAAIGLGLALAIHLTTHWLVARTGERFYSSTIIRHIVPGDRRELALVLLALVPVVLLEELLFRSLLLGGLAPVVPVGWLLVGLGVLFGLFHSPQGMWGMVGAAMAGVLFGLLFLWQQSLLLPLAAHYVANALQIVQAMRMEIDPEPT